MDRDAFLSRIAAAVLEAELPASPPIPEALPDLPEANLVELFRTRAQMVNCVVHGPMPRHSVPRAVVGIAGGHQIGSFATWDDLPAPGVSAALAAEGYTRILGDDGARDEFAKTPFAAVDLGVTGSSFGLAESGSVVLSHRDGKSRLLSALPEIHVALLHVDTIVRSLIYLARDEPDAITETANLVIVSGPSRTGDIEQHLNLGVHGPKHVHVVLIK